MYSTYANIDKYIFYRHPALSCYGACIIHSLEVSKVKVISLFL
jgi:hypothetical protein